MNDTKIELNPTQTVLVIGGYGFIGSRVVEQLEELGAYVIVGTRGKQLTRAPGTQKLLLHEMHTTEQWLQALQGVDVVVNAAGILRQRVGESYDLVHHQALKLIAQACCLSGIRLVHLSALGLDNPVRSRFLTSKRAGEKALQSSSADWSIVRASLVDGEGGYGAKWFRRVARWPVQVAPANATHKISPIMVDDLAAVIARIALRLEFDKENRIYEIGGPEKFTIFEYLDRLSIRTPLFRLRVPSVVARLASHLFDLMRFTPFSFGHYELLKFDNCPSANRAHEMLGIAPRPITATDKLEPKSMEGCSALTMGGLEQ